MVPRAAVWPPSSKCIAAHASKKRIASRKSLTEDDAYENTMDPTTRPEDHCTLTVAVYGTLANTHCCGTWHLEISCGSCGHKTYATGQGVPLLKLAM
jgi:hypothetical protein